MHGASSSSRIPSTSAAVSARADSASATAPRKLPASVSMPPASTMSARCPSGRAAASARPVQSAIAA